MTLPATTALSGGEQPPEELKTKTLQFLTEVVGINVDGYAMQWVTPPTYDWQKGAACIISDDNGTRVLNVQAVFVNGNITTFAVDVCVARTTFNVQYSESLSDIKRLMDRYHESSGVYHDIVSMLDGTSSSLPIETKLTDNGVLIASDDGVGATIATVELSSEKVSCRWEYELNGIGHIGYKELYTSIEWSNGKLQHLWFHDTWGIYKIGTTTVSISEKEAIRIAQESISDYVAELGAKVTKAGTTFLYHPRDSDRGNFTLYPSWTVWLYFDGTYERVKETPNYTYRWHVDGRQVWLWGDTGEVYDYQDLPLSYSSPSPTQGGSSLSWLYLLPPLLLLITPVVASAAVTLHRRKARNRKQ